MPHLRNSLFRFYYRAQEFLAPGLRNAQFAYRDVLEAKLSPETRWLDLGCGRRFLPDWMPGAEETQVTLVKRAKAVFGLDPDLASLTDNRIIQNRVAGDSGRLPFADNSFDLLTANMVVEHVAHPRELLAEALRVLRPRGVFVFHTPNLNSYATLLATLVPERIKVRLIAFLEGREGKDVFPTLYRMNTPRRVTEVAEAAGFRVVEVRLVESSAQAVILGPLVIPELIWIRILRLPCFHKLRSNMIAILQKTG